MQLRTVCDKRLYVPITSGSFEAKISIDIQQTFFFFVTIFLATPHTQEHESAGATTVAPADSRFS